MQKIENRFKGNSKLGDRNLGTEPDSLLAPFHSMTLNKTQQDKWRTGDAGGRVLVICHADHHTQTG